MPWDLKQLNLFGKETYLFDIMARFFPVISNSVIGRMREKVPFV